MGKEKHEIGRRDAWLIAGAIPGVKVDRGALVLAPTYHLLRQGLGCAWKADEHPTRRMLAGNFVFLYSFIPLVSAGVARSYSYNDDI